MYAMPKPFLIGMQLTHTKKGRVWRSRDICAQGEAPSDAVLAPVGAPVGAAAPVFPALGSPKLAPLTAPAQVRSFASL